MKLQSIRYTSNVSLPQAGDPNQAAREAGQRRENLNAGFNLLGEIAQAKTESDVLSSSARTAAELSDFEKRNAGKAVYTADEVRAIYDDLGVDDIPGLELTEEADGEMVDRQFISAEEVYPLALGLKSRQIIDRNADNITNPKAREQWINEANKRRDDIVTKVTLDARDNIQQAQVDRQKAEAAEYAAQGYIESARVIVSGMRIPDQEKQAMNQRLDEMGQEQINRDLAMAGDIPGMEARLEEMTSDEYKSSMEWDDPKEYDAQVSYLKTSLKAARAAEKSAIEESYKATRDVVFREVANAGPMESYKTAQRAIATMPLKKEDIASLLSLAESVANPKITEPDVYQMLVDQQMYDPEAFVQGNLLSANYGRLSAADRKSFEKARVSMLNAQRDGDDAATKALQTANQTIKQTQQRLGIYESSPSKAQAQQMTVVDRYIREQIQVWQANNPNKSITDEELNKISDSASAVLEVVQFDPVIGTDFLNPDERYTLDDISVEDYDRITNDYKGLGISPTAQDILEAYAKEQQGN